MGAGSIFQIGLLTIATYAMELLLERGFVFTAGTLLYQFIQGELLSPLKSCEVLASVSTWCVCIGVSMGNASSALRRWWDPSGVSETAKPCCLQDPSCSASSAAAHLATSSRCRVPACCRDFPHAVCSLSRRGFVKSSVMPTHSPRNVAAPCWMEATF